MNSRLPIVLAATLLLLGCHHGLKADSRSLPKAPAMPVTTVAVREARVSRPLDLTGTVIARNQVAIIPKTTGRIQELEVDEGYQVHAGQVVAVLETPELGWQVQQQRSGVSSAQATLRQAQDNLARMQNLAGQGVVSDQQLLQAKTQVQLAQSQLSQAKAGVSLMESNLDNHIVTSPVSGVV
ncbi:MAG: efflux RND transporter periplasmic adaptor subunit, partial [Cyanobacteria bacterium REEB65]|nr:efflux RND transporter periplasmic adaptor subunit [Cyanobacteria bacterium REEB65]